KAILNKYVTNFGHFPIKIPMKLFSKDKITIKIPIKPAKKLKTSNLPQEIEARVKYTKIIIPDISNMIFLRERFVFPGNADLIIFLLLIPQSPVPLRRLEAGLTGPASARSRPPCRQ
ncbi:MAG: hypothetical protein LBH26_08235, partial [Treponema sp.]|nr:hypothetical protein [Treponema sp.]